MEDSRYTDLVAAATARAAEKPDWVTFFREVLGIDGLVRRSFTDPLELAAFEKSVECAQMQEMLARLRETKTAPIETQRVITVRVPKSLHDLLKADAHESHTSMNQLCISKLLLAIDPRLVPQDAAQM